MSVKVDVEYCGICGTKSECEELSIAVKKCVPDAEVVCHEGRKGSFEVRINEILVHSKLSRLAYPDKNDVAAIAKDASQGKPVERNVSEMPITDCVIQ